MNQRTAKSYEAEFKAQAVKQALSSDESIAQTAHNLGVNEYRLHAWISKHPLMSRQSESSSARRRTPGSKNPESSMNVFRIKLALLIWPSFSTPAQVTFVNSVNSIEF